jgi:excisionase family DNA binding protein
MSNLLKRSLLKTTEAAALLGVSVATLEKWRQRGIGPAYQRTGPRTIRYHVSDLAAHQAECTVRPGR